MRQVILGLLVVGLLVGAAVAQYPYEPNAQTVINQPNHAVVNPQQMVPIPQMGTAAPPALIPPTENFRHGWRQTWTHEFRPFREHEIAPQPTTQWYPQQQQPAYQPVQQWYPQQQNSSGWYFNASTGCWQRSIQQPTYYYYPQRHSCW
ncbi:MAG: hypothetical protein WDA42_01500 [Candidatus Bathyarchaeia archaeon]